MRKVRSSRRAMSLTLMLLPLALLGACVTRADIRSPSGRVRVDENSLSITNNRKRRYANDDDDDDDD